MLRKLEELVKKSEIDDPKVEKIGEVGKLVKRIETGGSQARHLMKKVETIDRKVEELVKKIQMKDPKVEKVWKLVRFGQEKYKKPVHDAMLAGAGEEDEFTKCSDDTGKELL